MLRAPVEEVVRRQRLRRCPYDDDAFPADVGVRATAVAVWDEAAPDGDGDHGVASRGNEHKNRDLEPEAAKCFVEQ